MQRDNLLTHILELGDYLIQGLKAIENESNGLVHSTRGRGLFSAININSTAKRDETISKMMAQGILLGPAGSNAIRFRPSLNFTKAETDKLLDKLSCVIKSF